MNFEAALTAELRTITALNNRIYPLTSPIEESFDKTEPYLIFVTNEGQRTKELQGYQSSKIVRGELNVIAPTYAQMKDITKSVLAKVISFEGRVIGTGGPYIQEFTYEQPVELFEDKPKLYRSLIYFEIYIGG